MMQHFIASRLQFEYQLTDQYYEIEMPEKLKPFAEKGFADGIKWKKDYDALQLKIKSKEKKKGMFKGRYENSDLQKKCKYLFAEIESKSDYSAYSTVYFSHFIKAVDEKLYNIFGRFIEFALAGAYFIKHADLFATTKMDLATIALNKVMNKSPFFLYDDYYRVNGYRLRYTKMHKYSYFILALNSYIFTNACLIFDKGFEHYSKYIITLSEKETQLSKLLQLKSIFVKNNFITKNNTFPIASPFIRKNKNEGGVVIYEFFDERVLHPGLDECAMRSIMSLCSTSFKSLGYINKRGFLFLSFDLDNSDFYLPLLDNGSLYLDDLKILNDLR